MIPYILGGIGFILGIILGSYIDYQLGKTEWGKEAKKKIDSIFSL